MLRKSLAGLLVSGALLSFPAIAQAQGQAQGQAQLSPQEIFVLTGVYDEMRTCFGFIAVVSAAAKQNGDAEEEKYYEDQGYTFMKGYDFFGKKAGKSSDVIAADVSQSIMKMHERSQKLTNTLPLKLTYGERCTQLAKDPQPIMMEYIQKYGGPR